VNVGAALADKSLASFREHVDLKEFASFQSNIIELKIDEVRW
jgi:hypothetical protein